MIYPNHLGLLDLTIRIHTMRHHHQTVELRPRSEASPRGLRGITSLHEAPPRDLRGITSWPWGTTMIPPVELRPYVGAPPWTLTPRFMELSLITEAPPWTPSRRAHGIMSIWWGTTTSPTTRVMGLRPTQALLIHNQPIMKFLCIPLTCHLVYMTNHQSYLMPSSLLIH